MFMVNCADVHALERCWAFLLSTRCISTHRTRTEELAKQLCVIHHAIATVSPDLANRDLQNRTLPDPKYRPNAAHGQQIEQNAKK